MEIINYNKYFRSLLIHGILFIALLFPISIKMGSVVYLQIILGIIVFYYTIRTFMDVKWGILIFLMLMPLLPFTWTFYLGPALPYLTIRRLLFIILIIAYIFRDKSKFIAAEPLPKILNILFILLFISYLFSTLFAEYTGVSLNNLFHFIVEQVLLMYVISRILTTNVDCKLGLLSLIFAGIVLSVFAISEFITKENYFTAIKLSKDISTDLWTTYANTTTRIGFKWRISSLSTHPMILGGFLAIIIPLTFGFLLREEKKMMSFFFLICLIIFSGSLFLTISRSPILATLVSLILFFWLIRKNIRLWTLFIIISVVAILITVMLIVDEKFQTLFFSALIFWQDFEGVENTGSSFADRMVIFSNVLFYVKANPVFGYGLGNSTILIGKGFFKNIGMLENYWLSKLLESGIIGFSILVAILYNMLKYLGQLYQKNRILRDVFLISGIIAGFISFLVFATATGEMTLSDYCFILFPLAYNLVNDSQSQVDATMTSQENDALLPN